MGGWGHRKRVGGVVLTPSQRRSLKSAMGLEKKPKNLVKHSYEWQFEPGQVIVAHKDAPAVDVNLRPYKTIKRGESVTVIGEPDRKNKNAWIDVLDGTGNIIKVKISYFTTRYDDFYHSHEGTSEE